MLSSRPRIAAVAFPAKRAALACVWRESRYPGSRAHGAVIPLGCGGDRDCKCINLYSFLRIAMLFIAAGLTNDCAIAYGR
jgi:hypothetical protein